MEMQTALERTLAVGRVGPRSVRFWLRSPGGGPHVLELWPEEHPSRRNSWTFELPPSPATDWTYALDAPEELRARLEPCTRYRLRVTRRDDLFVGEAGFDTAPETFAQTPSRFTVGLMSCHQPFDEDGSPRPGGLAMLKAARTALDRSQARFLLQCGDQFYADYPVSQSIFSRDVLARMGSPHESIFSCDRDTVRRLYQARYRWCWGMPEYLALQSQTATYPMLDDHEVIDNWHSQDEHLDPRFTPVRQGARAAYEDYQHARVAGRAPFDESSYHYAFDWGAVGVFVMDVRSQRVPELDHRDGQVCGEAQLRDLTRWLQAHREYPVVLLVASVPLFFMPGWLAFLAGRLIHKVDGDAHDRWSHPQFVHERSRLLSILHAHQQQAPQQKLLICSGDVHVGYVTRCRWKGTPEVVTHQLVSSAITHEMTSRDRAFGRWVPRTQQSVHTGHDHERGRLDLIGEGRHQRFHQPVGALNIGLIEIELEKGQATLNLKLVGSDEQSPGEPVTRLETYPF